MEVSVTLNRAGWGLIEALIQHRIEDGEKSVKMWEGLLAEGKNYAQMGLDETQALLRLHRGNQIEIKKQLDAANKNLCESYAQHRANGCKNPDCGKKGE